MAGLNATVPFQVTIGKAVAEVPPNGQHDHFRRKPKTIESRHHRRRNWMTATATTAHSIQPYTRSLNATVPLVGIVSSAPRTEFWTQVGSGARLGTDGATGTMQCLVTPWNCEEGGLTWIFRISRTLPSHVPPLLFAQPRSASSGSRSASEMRLFGPMHEHCTSAKGGE